MNKTCEDCKFFFLFVSEYTQEDNRTECHLHAPTWAIDNNGETFDGWPDVEPEVDWCGEFKDNDPDNNY